MILLCAALLCLCAAGAAEEAVPVHDESHRTVEQAHGAPYAVRTDSMEAHAWVTVYDLYCEDCGRVIEANVRAEETEQPHEWSETRQEPTCTGEGLVRNVCVLCGAEKTEEVPPLGHTYASAAELSGREAGSVSGGDGLIGTVIEPSTCAETGVGVLVCLRCQEAEITVTIPTVAHTFTEWEEPEVPEEMVCVTDAVRTRRCLVCGLEETETLSPAPGHQWAAVSFSEPTCTEPGIAVRQCTVCGEEETIESPAFGHCYMWMDVNQPNGDIVSEYVCTICGDVAERKTKSNEQIYYNNTITSFGPMTRELIGGGVWNRVTPLNLAEEGMFTYPLIASNLYTVGTATVINEKGTQVINYKLNTRKINVHTQTLVIYPNMDALRTGENAVVVEFDQPVELGEYFGEDQQVLMAITLKADYDANAPGVQDFREDEALIAAMAEMID